jgi:DNA helicase HerA-like ATPase
LGGLLLRTAPRPTLRAGEDAAGQLPTAYFGVRIDAAVNLLEAREFEGLDRAERLRKALEEQRSFLNGLLDPSLGVLLDLRTRVRPGTPSPVEIALLGRVGDRDQAAAADRAEGIRRHVFASLPRHVIGSEIEDDEDLTDWLAPIGGDWDLDAALITRREVIAAPRRPDARVGYYFSVVPFNWIETDWTNLYSALSATRVPVALSVALLPVKLPSQFTLLLEHMATFYGRLAREDRQTGGLYYGERLLPPDAFAVDAEPVFRDYARRYSGRVFLMRIEVAAKGALPPGLTESIAAAISPADAQRDHLAGERAASTYEIRAAKSPYEREVARWNLDAVDVRPLEGSADIWRRADPPAPELALLGALGDARDASSAFRLPIALDGTVPGFRVRRGSFGHVEAPTGSGARITLGHVPGRDDAVSVPVRSLTRHTLVAGSTGSGKTTTVLELLRQLWLDHRVPFMVIEPVNSDANDYRRLLAEPGFEELELITVGDEGLRPLRFNPFEVPLNVLVAEHIANLHACFKAAFGLWEPLPSIYRDALNLTYLHAGILASERADGEPRAWPTAVEFLQAMRKVTADLGYTGEVRSNIEAASIRRAEQLVTGVAASAFLTTQPNDIAALLDHPVVIELKSLGSGDEQALMMALLLNAITEHYQAVRGASTNLEHLTVIEEAHRLLERSAGGRGQEEAQAKEKAAEAFANTLAENRKYGEGVMIAEQLPTKLVEDAVKNTDLKVLHRLTAEEDRRYIGETMGFDDAQMRYATRLSTGEGLVYGAEFPEALLVDVRPRLSPGSQPQPESSAAPPFAACDACRAQCTYRGAALAMVRDQAIVEELQKAVGALEDRGRQDQAEADWESLLSLLRGRVAAFAALPSEEPGRSDAAYCLFLHAVAIRRAHVSPAWPEAVAARLGIEAGLTNGSGE